MIIWKGRGFLVLVYLIITTIGLGITNGLVCEYLEIQSKDAFELFVGFIFLIAGIWTRLTSDDYYLDKDGRRKNINIVNELYFIKMKTWAYILMVIGSGFIVYGLAKLI